MQVAGKVPSWPLGAWEDHVLVLVQLISKGLVFFMVSFLSLSLASESDSRSGLVKATLASTPRLNKQEGPTKKCPTSSIDTNIWP